MRAKWNICFISHMQYIRVPCLKSFALWVKKPTLFNDKRQREKSGPREVNPARSLQEKAKFVPLLWMLKAKVNILLLLRMLQLAPCTAGGEVSKRCLRKLGQERILRVLRKQSSNQGQLLLATHGRLQVYLDNNFMKWCSGYLRRGLDIPFWYS